VRAEVGRQARIFIAAIDDAPQKNKKPYRLSPMRILRETVMLTVNDLTVSYEGKNAVEKVCFDVSEGDYLCVLGENGSGKTTLVKAVLGLLKKDGGEIVFKDLKAGEIGYLPQQTAAQRDFPASVFEVVLSGRLNRRGGAALFYGARDKKNAEANLEKLGISGLKKRSYA
jgi:zinc transport system ATP-binding protein